MECVGVQAFYVMLLGWVSTEQVLPRVSACVHYLSTFIYSSLLSGDCK